MFPLMRWSPRRDLRTLQREMDDLFNMVFGRGAETWQTVANTWYPALDVARKGDNIVVHAELPGVDPKDVDITVTGNLLTIRGERKMEKKVEEEDYFFHEIGKGTFERSITLPVDVSTENIKATYKNGMLEIKMPAEAAVKGKKIEIVEEKTKELKAA